MLLSDSLKHPGGFTKFQNTDGYWMLDKKVAYAFGSTITEVKKENPLRVSKSLSMHGIRF